ncbi:MAG: TusE/DsrC/DsvC family sulfur relay protein [Corallincola sp.]|nr:TusE/DsrC/DsvC family sulfur relay protein [Corallincola sp.]
MYQLDGQDYPTDAEGYLKDKQQWHEPLVSVIAAAEQLPLTAEHWHLIRFVRAFDGQFKTTPAMRLLVKELKTHFGDDKGSSTYLHRLFPGGPAKQCAKLAGLPKPAKCI